MQAKQTLERALKIYKATYDVTYDYFADLLDIRRDAFLKKRKGQSQFSAKELHELSEALGMSMDECYELLPPINH